MRINDRMFNRVIDDPELDEQVKKLARIANEDKLQHYANDTPVSSLKLDESGIGIGYFNDGAVLTIFSYNSTTGRIDMLYLDSGAVFYGYYEVVQESDTLYDCYGNSTDIYYQKELTSSFVEDGTLTKVIGFDSNGDLKKANMPSGGTKLYKHVLQLEDEDNTPLEYVIINTNNSPFTAPPTSLQLANAIRFYGYYDKSTYGELSYIIYADEIECIYLNESTHVNTMYEFVGILTLTSPDVVTPL